MTLCATKDSMCLIFTEALSDMLFNLLILKSGTYDSLVHNARSLTEQTEKWNQPLEVAIP